MVGYGSMGMKVSFLSSARVWDCTFKPMFVRAAELPGQEPLLVPSGYVETWNKLHGMQIH